MDKLQKVALFDMDDTICNYRGQLMDDLSKRFSKQTLGEIDLFQRKLPLEIRIAIKEIRSEKGWWKNLPFLESGKELWSYMRSEGYETHVATKGPYNDSNGWKEKLEWQKIFIPEAENFTITLDKSYIRGDVLIDDWPKYVISWLNKNPKGKAILPFQTYNLDFKHERAIHYANKNFEELANFL